MKVSSAFKVGLLTIISLSILVFTVMWIKGRSLSGGTRYNVEFKDVNGIRTGSAVQMMGLRIGQIESITPIIKEENSFVDVKFVITEPNIKIPLASTISIQQSGLIGEQFLEIMPPQIRVIYIPAYGEEDNILKAQDKVEMLLSSKYHNVGYIKSVDIVETNTLGMSLKNELNSDYAYKVNYIINLPGLVIPDRLNAKIIKQADSFKLRITPWNGIKIAYPETNSNYTVINPMRLSDFMELQHKSASSLHETNERISTLLSDDLITDLKITAENLNILTEKTTQAVEKAEMLIDATRDDLAVLVSTVDNVSNSVIELTTNLNSIVGDESFKKTLISSTQSVGELSENINSLLEDPKMQQTITDLQVTTKNISEISTYINDMTKDQKLKCEISKTITKINKTLDELSLTLNTVNSIAVEDKDEIKEAIENASVISKNLRKFSEKLNKRFLLFRLMF